MKKMTGSKSAKATKEIALTAVLSAAYAVAIMLIIIPSPTGGYTQIGDFVVFASALLFGYRVGGSVGVMVLWQLICSQGIQDGLCQFLLIFWKVSFQA